MQKNIFIGREKELLQLKTWLSEADKGLGRVALINGYPGSGKSTLIKKFLLDFENNEKYLIADSECTDKEGINAYLPFKEILAKITAETVNEKSKLDKKQKNELLKNFIFQAGSSWVNLIPVIGNIAAAGIETFKSYREVYKNQPQQQIQGEVEIQQIFEKEFRKVADKKTLILFIDDLQWADNSSLNLLFTLCRSIRKNPFKVLLIGTFRPNDLNIGRNKISEYGQNIIVRHPLVDKINELRNYTKTDIGAINNEKWFYELEILPFSSSEVQTFIGFKFPKNTFDKSFSDKIYKLTQGHPLFVNEILQNLVERNLIFADNSGNYTAKDIDLKQLPTSINGVISERIERLDKELQKIISYASIDGTEVTVNILEKLLKIDELDLLDFLEQLNKKHGLLAELEPKKINDQLIELYNFTNTLVHKYIYESIDASRRRALHRKIAEILKETYGEAISTNEDLKKRFDLHTQIGQGLIDGITLKLNDLKQENLQNESNNLEQQNSIIDAIKTVILTAKDNFEQYAMQECIDNADKALAFILNAGNSNEVLLLNFEALKLKISAFNWKGLYQEALVYSVKLLQIAQNVNNNEYIASAFATIAKCLENTGNYEKSIEFYSKAMEINKNLNEIQYAENLNDLGSVLVRYGKYDLAINNFEIAKKVFEKNKNDEKLAESIMNIGYAYRMFGDYDKAISFYNISLTFFSKLNIKRKIADCYNNVGLCFNWKGEYKKAISFFEKSLQIDSEINDVVNKANHLSNIGLAKESLGDYQGAIEYFKKALEIDTNLNDKVKIPLSYSNIGDCFTRQGNDFDKALEFHNKALEIYKELNDEVNIAYCYQNIGEVYRLTYNTDKSFEFFNNALEIDLKIGDIKAIAYDYVNISNILMQKEEYEKSLDYLYKAIEHFEKINDRISMAVIYNNLASSYYMLKNYEKSFTYINKAIQINKSVNDKIELKRNYIILGNLYEDQEEYDQAISVFQKALKLSQELNYTIDSADIYNRIGVIYDTIENYKQAIEFYQKASELNAQTNDFESEIKNKTNIANIYIELKQYEDALNFFDQCRDIASENDMLPQLADSLIDVGFVYDLMQKNDSALNFFQIAAELYIRLKSYTNMKVAYDNMTVVYQRLGQFAKGIEFQNKIVEIYENAGLQEELADTFLFIGTLNYNLDYGDEALKYFEKSLYLYKSSDNNSGMADCYYNKGLVYKYNNDNKKALENFKLCRDFLNNLGEDTTEADEQIEQLETKLKSNSKKDDGFKPGKTK